MSGQPWPFPGDSQADRARWVARWVFEALREENQGRAEHLREVVERFGEHWLSDPLDAGRDERVSTRDAAALVQRREATVRSWLARATVPVHRGADGLISVADLLAVDAAMRRRRRDLPGC